MPTWSPNEPFNDLPALSSEVQIDISSISSRLIEARVQLARLDEVAKNLSNPISFVNSIAIVEAQASSAIENIVTTNDTLFQNLAANSSAANPETKTAMRNRAALQTAYRMTLQRPVTANLAIQICSEILGFEANLRASKGTYIGSLGNRVYTPLEGESRIALMLQQWQDFINQDTELDPLLVMALSHYQFEAIHPFADGNGRTGRVLNIALILQSGLLTHPVLHLSTAINSRKTEYYDRLERVTSRGEWSEWVGFMLEVVAAGARTSAEQITRINKMQTSLVGAFSGDVFKKGVTNELASILHEMPYCRIEHVAKACNLSRPTAAKWLEELERIGFLASIRVGREKYFINKKMLEVLN